MRNWRRKLDKHVETLPGTPHTKDISHLYFPWIHAAWWHVARFQDRGTQPASVSQVSLSREFQMTQSTNDHVFVSLISGNNGEERVSLELSDGQLLLLSASQARALATNLITAVNRAEVKASLRVSTNLWRRQDGGEARLSLAR
jgi:hypothetical protein